MRITHNRRHDHLPGRTQQRFLCLDCNENILSIGEYYALRDEVLLQANPTRQGKLCIGCLEARLGRCLTPVDFKGTPLTHHLLNGTALSLRLMSRIGGPQDKLMRIHRELGLIYFDHPHQNAVSF